MEEVGFLYGHGGFADLGLDFLEVGGEAFVEDFAHFGVFELGVQAAEDSLGVVDCGGIDLGAEL